jgi:hypothetical protein
MGEDRRAALRQQVAGLEAYARLKLEARDWHGLADAAMDIREVVAQLSELERVERAWPPPDPPAGDVMYLPKCDAVVMGEPCVMIAGHQGEHMNAAEWRAESR